MAHSIATYIISSGKNDFYNDILPLAQLASEMLNVVAQHGILLAVGNWVILVELCGHNLFAM